MTKAKKRIMREFALDEISAVTRPAQEGARMVLMKRADAAVIEAQGAGGQATGSGGKRDLSKLSADEIAALVLKGECALTSEVNGHSHLIDLDTFTRERGGGFTSSCWCDGTDHSHPFVISEGGKITIGMAQGHTHEVMTADAVKAAAGAPVSDSTQEGEDMDQKELATLRALSEMNDAQKDYFGKLGAAEQEAFIAASPADRAAAVTKAAGPDPVVYTAKNGAEYRKSDDPRLVQIAKDRDADIAAAAVEKAARVEAEAVTLAKSWSHIGKPMDEKIADARAILAASPEAKKAALDAIEASRAALAPLFTSHGARGEAQIGKSDRAEAEEKLNEMAEELATKSGITTPEALVKVLATPAGARLYAKAKPRLSAVL